MDLSAFIEIEKKYDLYNVQIDGVMFWIYARFEIWEKYIVKSRGTDSHKKNFASKFSQFNKMTRLLIYVIKPKKIRKNVDICFFCHERRVLQDGFYECIYTKHLTERYPNHIVLGAPYDGKHTKPVRTPYMYETDGIIAKSYIYYLWTKTTQRNKYQKLIKEIYNLISDALNEVEEIYKLKIDKTGIVSYIAKKILMHKARYPLYKNLIRKINPLLIVEVVSYEMNRMLVNEVAYELGIPTIELQHGSIHDGHIPYRYGTVRTIRQFPQKFFLFADYYKKNSSMPISDKNQIVTGFPYMETEMEKYRNVEKKQKKIILFLSQYTVSDEMGACAFKLSKMLETEKYQIVFKLHPLEYDTWKMTYPYLVDSSVQVVDNNDISLYELFASSFCQVGAYSTTIFEGMAYDLITFILKTNRSHVMSYLWENGYATYVENAQELCEELQRYNEMDSFDGANKNTFWKTNAIENQIREIDKCLANGQRSRKKI